MGGGGAHGGGDIDNRMGLLRDSINRRGKIEEEGQEGEGR